MKLVVCVKDIPRMEDRSQLKTDNQVYIETQMFTNALVRMLQLQALLKTTILEGVSEFFENCALAFFNLPNFYSISVLAALR